MKRFALAALLSTIALSAVAHAQEISMPMPIQAMPTIVIVQPMPVLPSTGFSTLPSFPMVTPIPTPPPPEVQSYPIAPSVRCDDDTDSCQ